jgi:hypothetical protein
MNAGKLMLSNFTQLLAGEQPPLPLPLLILLLQLIPRPPQQQPLHALQELLAYIVE